MEKNSGGCPDCGYQRNKSSRIKQKMKKKIVNGNRGKKNISQSLELKNTKQQLQTKILRQQTVDRRQTYRNNQTIG